MDPSIGGLIDLAHTPLADEGGHVVMGEARADLQSHELMVLIELILATWTSPVYPAHRMTSEMRTNASCEASFSRTRSSSGQPTIGRSAACVRFGSHGSVQCVALATGEVGFI